MRRALLLLLVPLALALAACGSGDGEEALSPAAAVAEAAGNTQSADTARFDFNMTLNAPGFEGPVELPGNGVVDNKEKRSRLTMDLSGFPAPEGQSLGLVEVILDELVLYMRIPQLEQLTGKPWLKADLRTAGKQRGLDLGALQQANQTDPTQALAYLKAGSEDVEEVGTETVRDVETTHYRMTVDLKKAAAASSEEQRASVDELIEQSGIQKVPTEAWVDGDGLVRRLVQRYENIRFSPTEQGDMTISIEMYDFGADVEVELPPEDQVTDFADLAQGGS